MNSSRLLPAIFLLAAAGPALAEDAWRAATPRRPLVTASDEKLIDVEPVAATAKQRQGKQSPAIVRVWARQEQFSSGGSGTLVAKDENGRGLILTNRHVVADGGRIEIHWPTGEQSAGTVEAVGGGGDDLAAIFTDVPEGIEPLEVREDEPSSDETLWMAGYGGSSERFAFGPGSYHAWDEVNAEINGTYARHGDSGGPIVDEQGRLAAVLWGSNFADHTVCIRLPRVRSFLRKVGKLLDFDVGPCQCGGGASARGSGSRSHAPRVLDGDDDFSLDEPGFDGDDAGEPQPAPREQSNTAELEAQLEKLTKRLAELEQQKAAPGPPGPAGPPGPPGPAGADGKDADGELALALTARIDILEKQLAALGAGSSADHGHLADVGPHGDMLNATPKISHIVLLVDKAAPEWARIANTFLDRAQDRMPVHVVDYSAVPWKLRQLPQAVVYNTAHEAVSVAKGFRDVELTLAAVDRGDIQ